jgi:hypothetical protein
MGHFSAFLLEKSKGMGVFPNEAPPLWFDTQGVGWWFQIRGKMGLWNDPCPRRLIHIPVYLTADGQAIERKMPRSRCRRDV